jgi:uncharacterized protein
MIAPFTDSDGEPFVRGFWHVPNTPNRHGIVLTHGAGSNCQTKLLVDVANALMESGFEVLRIDLPFRQARPQGPPFPNAANRDREGIRRALTAMKSKVKGSVFAGGHSYGGRQATILISAEPQLADGLLLLSYPLHPPGKPQELRTAHFPKLTKPAFFVHGVRDPFGSIAEMSAALELITGRHMLIDVDRAGHDLTLKDPSALCQRIAREFQNFVDEQGTV